MYLCIDLCKETEKKVISDLSVGTGCKGGTIGWETGCEEIPHCNL